MPCPAWRSLCRARQRVSSGEQPNDAHPGLASLLAGVTPASALPAEPADLPALEKTWHTCVRVAYDRQPERGSRAGRERNLLDECKPDEDTYVAALMAARPDDPDMAVHG